MIRPGLSPFRYAFAGMIGLAVAMGVGRFVYTPILPGMMQGLGLSASDAGLIASANFLGYLLGALVAGGAWGQGRERTVMLAALAGSAALAGLMGATEDLGAFLLLRFLAGIASAFVMVFFSAIVLSRLDTAGRNELQALYFGGVGIGMAVSALMTGLLDVAGADWPAGWFWSGALSAIGALAVLAMIRGGPARAGAAKPEPPLSWSRALTRVVLAYGIFGFGYSVTATFLVAIVREGEAGRLFESVVWLATGLAAAPSVWLWNRISRRIGMTAAFATGCAVEAAGVAASVSLGSHAGPLCGGVLLGGTFVAITAYGLQAGRRLAGDAPRRAFALMTAAFGLGQILGPIAAGVLADWTGSFVLPSLGAAAALLIAAAIAFDGRRDAHAAMKAGPSQSG